MNSNDNKRPSLKEIKKMQEMAKRFEKQGKPIPFFVQEYIDQLEKAHKEVN